MYNKIKIVISLVFLLYFLPSISAMEINSEVIAQIPQEIANNLVGMRVYQDSAYIMASDGNYITIDLITGSISKNKIKTNRVIDFDVVLGKIIYLNEKGMLSGYVFPKWPKGPFSDICRIEACDQGVVLSGGNKTYFISKNATSTLEIPGLGFSLPINNGFMWSVSLGEEGIWEANLHDCFGNLMGKVYKFNESYEPSDIELGPEGVDGELLISSTEKNTRSLALIGNNGRMFWKINTGEKVCNRDAAFGPMGDFFILERTNNGNIILNRWKFTVPEG